MDNTFCSTDPDKYYEVECPVNYVGVAKQLKWYVSSINTIYAIEMFGPDDYIDFECPGLDDTVLKIRISLDKYYKSMEDSRMTIDINTKLENVGITFTSDDLDRYCFTSSAPFKITDMSYNLKQALGFYYLKNVNLEAELINYQYVIKAKSRGYTNLSPIWFLLSNLGSPNIISSTYSPYESWYPSIAMKIQNSFTTDQPLQYGNGDFMSITQASSLGNLKVRLVDCNLRPVKLLYPLYVTISFSEMGEDHAEIEEAMAVQESNPDTYKLIDDYQKKISESFIKGIMKVEGGISRDDELPEKPQPREATVHASEEIKETANEELNRDAVVQEKTAAQDIHETPPEPSTE